MTLTVTGSGSSGNGYILDAGDECLILEAGIRLDRVKQALNFNVRKIAGVLVSHVHGDHAGRAAEYDALTTVYAGAGVIGAKKLKRAVEITPGTKFTVGGFRVMPFDVEHDVPCLGFFIHHPRMGNLLFLTDSPTCDYRFKNANHILIECNYSRDLLEQSVENGLHPFVAQRVTQSHMELNTCRDILLEQDLSRVYSIILIHLSGNNSDGNEFADRLRSATGKPVAVAGNGLEFDLYNPRLMAGA
ncbi:MAG: MBL fold metallo-hydrolase [Tannerella sp.]|jgi:phosphoribosyl 1,2-cyclic phosphodiesterase|nr:MBL fold metallo-hydrolase [Tannerella sp.]